MIKKIVIFLFFFFLYSINVKAASFSSEYYIIKYPNEWIHAYKAPTLTLIPENNVTINIDTYKVSELSDSLKPLKVKSGKKGPINLLDVLNFKYLTELADKGWKTNKTPEVEHIGPYKTIYIELVKDSQYMALTIFEKEYIFAFKIITKNKNEFTVYKNNIREIITKNFSVKIGNPIYMVIGMTIAYAASFIGLIAAYLYYKKRKGDTKNE
ncbi:MAG: hypothetical protein SVN78_01760 [Deferribacterota bacterium]|nr:hypothetical protein [Deferribacterota bacterium]